MSGCVRKGSRNLNKHLPLKCGGQSPSLPSLKHCEMGRGKDAAARKRPCLEYATLQGSDGVLSGASERLRCLQADTEPDACVRLGAVHILGRIWAAFRAEISRKTVLRSPSHAPSPLPPSQLCHPLAVPPTQSPGLEPSLLLLFPFWKHENPQSRIGPDHVSGCAGLTGLGFLEASGLAECAFPNLACAWVQKKSRKLTGD